MYLGEIVETATSEELYRNPIHPYTQALLSSIPTMTPGKKRDRIVLEGDVPSPINPPGGCRFHPRCPLAEAICSREAPREVHLDDHYFRCHVMERQLGLSPPQAPVTQAPQASTGVDAKNESA